MPLDPPRQKSEFVSRFELLAALDRISSHASKVRFLTPSSDEATHARLDAKIELCCELISELK